MDRPGYCSARSAHSLRRPYENGSSREQIGKKLEKYFGMSEEGASEYLEHFLQEEGCLSTI